MQSQELVADMMSVLGDRERQVYVKPQTSSTEEEAIIEEVCRRIACAMS